TAPRLVALSTEGKEEASGFRMRRGAEDDLLFLAPSAGLRRFGPREDACVTDAEAAYVRRTRGRVTEAGLVAGRRLELAGKTLIEVGPDIVCARVRYNGDIAELNTRGSGVVRVAK